MGKCLALSTTPANSLPRTTQPDRTIKPNTHEGDQFGLDNRNVKLYEYTNSKGKKIHIRQDKAASYEKGGVGDQSPQFNAALNDPLSLKLQRLREESAYDADLNCQVTALKFFEKISMCSSNNIYLIVAGNDITAFNSLSAYSTPR